MFFLRLLKWVLRTVLALLGVLVVAIGVLAAVIGFGSMAVYKDDGYVKNDLADWMRYAEDSALVKNLVLPGSHDAGSEGMMYMGKTQKDTLEGQLLRGARYFDIRVTEDDGELKIFHGPLKGDVYVSFLEEIDAFLTSYPTEGLLLDFQHFGEGAHDETMTVLEEKLGSERLLKKKDPAKSDLDFVDGLTLGELRGKCLVTVGVEAEKRTKDFEFVRDKDSEKREGSVLSSPYDATLNKLPSDKYIEYGLKAYLAARAASPEGLFVLQGQLTDGFTVFGPAYREGQHLQNMSAYVRSLPEKKEFPLINVIMRDFLNAEKCAEILWLNTKKEGIFQGENLTKMASLFEGYMA